MTTYHVGFDDGTCEFVAGASYAQAFRNAAAIRPREGFTLREATAEEQAALLAANSAHLETNHE